MEKRKLGKQGLEVSALGLGCMGMSTAYGRGDDAESIRVLHRALDLGINFWDTAQSYGPFKNEELIGRALQGKRREEVIIATKFAWQFGPAGEMVVLDSSPANIRKTTEESLRRLQTDYIDLYLQHRLDPKTPIEETIGALAELVQAGKVCYIGLCEVGPATIRRAHAIHPLSAIQSEYSLWEREVEDKVLPVLRELGIGFVAYSPMSRGLLTGKIKDRKTLEESDWRLTTPRFQPENLEHNLQLVKAVEEIASANQVTTAQLALAWALRQGKDIVPIPGTKRVTYLEENARAATLQLPESVWKQLDQAASAFTVAGARYSERSMKWIDRSE